MKAKRVLALTLSLILVAALAACSGGDTSSTSAAAEQPSADAPAAESAAADAAEAPAGGVEVEYWVSWTPGADTETNSLEKFKEWEAATGNKINHSVATYDMLHDKLVAAGSANNAPDLVWGLPEWTGEFYNMGFLSDLTEQYNAWEGKSEVYESVTDAMKVGDTIVGVPYEMTLRAFLVHDNVNTEAGVETPKTWEELMALTDYYATTGKYPYGVAGTGVRSPQELLVYLAQYDLEIATLQADGKYKNTWQDDPAQMEKATKVFQFYLDLQNNGIIDPSSKTWGWEETDENFATGMTGMYVTGNWLAERESTNVEAMADVSVSPIPYPAEGKPATYMEAKPLFIFNSAKHPAEAFDLATFCCSVDYQQTCFADRSPLKSVFTDTKWSKDFSALADTGVVFPSVTLGGITQAMIDSLAKVMQNGESPADTALWLSEQINLSLQDSGELSA